MGDGIRGKLPSLGQREATCRDGFNQRAILLRAGNHRREGMILRRRPQQAGPADVDQLNRLSRRHRRIRGRPLKRVEAHDHRIEELDAMLGKHSGVVCAITPRQQPSKNLGM